jgi:hypothetical protein
MNQPDSSEEKLMCKWTHGLNDSDTSSTELEQDSIRTSANHVRSNDDGTDDDDDDNFWI